MTRRNIQPVPSTPWVGHLVPGSPIYLTKEFVHATVRRRWLAELGYQTGTIELRRDGADANEMWYVTEYGYGIDGSLLMQPVILTTDRAEQEAISAELFSRISSLGGVPREQMEEAAAAVNNYTRQQIRGSYPGAFVDLDRPIETNRPVVEVDAEQQAQVAATPQTHRRRNCRRVSMRRTIVTEERLKQVRAAEAAASATTPQAPSAEEQPAMLQPFAPGDTVYVQYVQGLAPAWSQATLEEVEYHPTSDRWHYHCRLPSGTVLRLPESQVFATEQEAQAAVIVLYGSLADSVDFLRRDSSMHSDSSLQNESNDLPEGTTLFRVGQSLWGVYIPVGSSEYGAARVAISQVMRADNGITYRCHTAGNAGMVDLPPGRLFREEANARSWASLLNANRSERSSR